MMSNGYKKWTESEKTDRLKVIGSGEVGKGGCPQCKSRKVIPTGKTFRGDRTYNCLNCGSFFGSPTTHAECEKFGIIGNDLIINDCLVCPIPKKEGFDIFQLIKEGKACPYFKKIIGKKLTMDDIKDLEVRGDQN